MQPDRLLFAKALHPGDSAKLRPRLLPGLRGGTKEPECLDARNLAAGLVELLEVGMFRRRRGMCLGVGLAKWLSNGPGARSSVKVLQVWRAVRHARGRHDDGCFAFGVSLREIARVLARVDRVGASPLLLEAVFEAAAEVCGSQKPWSVQEATETLELHLRRRITPGAGVET